MLIIQNCKFRNFIYEFNTFIELNSWGGIISITSTTFNRFSNCGAIIRNTKAFYGSSNFNSKSTSTYNSGFTTHVQNYIATIDAEIYDSTQTSPLSCSNATSAPNPCYSINLTSNVFQNFGYNKGSYSVTNYPPLVNPSLGMQYWGLVLSLNSFQGQISVISNTFSKNTLSYTTGCSISSNIQLSTSASTSNIWDQTSATYSQMRNIISIRGTLHNIVIVGNTFNNNEVTKGVIYIESEIRTNPVLIASNTFTSNFGFYSTIGIFIRAFSESAKPTNTIFATSESANQCGGYTISKNAFISNLGCPIYSTSMVQFECMDISYKSSIYTNDSSYFENITDYSSTVMTTISSLTNLATASTQTNSSMKILGVTYIIPTYFLTLSQNTYYGNYASNGNGIISIRGVQFPRILNETLQNNGESYNSLLSTYNYTYSSDSSTSTESSLNYGYNSYSAIVIQLYQFSCRV